MKYEKITEAKFIERENRFVARVQLADGEICRVHVKNTGRCRELLLPGSKVYLEDFEGRMGSRRMRYSLVAVEKERGGSGNGNAPASGADAGTLLINMDSQAPNKVVHEAMTDYGLSLIKPEAKYGNSRFDFYVEDDDRRSFIEVKGVTLEEDGHARFPDAPTERGLRHINELIQARREGYGAYILFVVQMEGMKDVSPNYDTHREFGEALAKAQEAGVKILAYDCKVTPDTLTLNRPVRFTL